MQLEDYSGDLFIPLIIRLHPCEKREGKWYFQASIDGLNKSIGPLDIEDICNATWASFEEGQTSLTAKQLKLKYLEEVDKFLESRKEKIKEKIESLSK